MSEGLPLDRRLESTTSTPFPSPIDFAEVFRAVLRRQLDTSGLEYAGVNEPHIEGAQINKTLPGILFFVKGADGSRHPEIYTTGPDRLTESEFPHIQVQNDARVYLSSVVSASQGDIDVKAVEDAVGKAVSVYVYGFTQGDSSVEKYAVAIDPDQFPQVRVMCRGDLDVLKGMMQRYGVSIFISGDTKIYPEHSVNGTKPQETMDTLFMAGSQEWGFRRADGRLRAAVDKFFEQHRKELTVSGLTNSQWMRLRLRARRQLAVGSAGQTNQQSIPLRPLHDLIEEILHEDGGYL